MEFARKVSDLAALVKFRLSATVVLSSVLAYLVALEAGGVSWWAVGVLTAGGFLTTAAANILNEILEKDYDRQMERTRRRPLAEGRMSSSEALLMAGFASLGGISFLALFNPWTAILGMISLMSYAFVYTPLKRVGPVAVVVGAVPGALPALIGCAAAEGAITGLGVTLFTIQFFWQLPHFYAIGFLGSADYRKAGFRLVPEIDGKVDVRTLGRDAIIATLVLIPLSLLPYALGVTSAWATVLVALLGVVFFYYALNFYRRPERSTALRMMFFSFAYLPLVFTVYWAGKLYVS
ncbi:heme o synthase [Neolewinella litorea]|uniref:heme o synthase n=1 Tax=Neolewinella litorea TaxID=2562452 RepID=UPI001FE861DC|nr:heme o synthase [Neolewinella litorea]